MINIKTFIRIYLLGLFTLIILGFAFSYYSNISLQDIIFYLTLALIISTLLSIYQNNLKNSMNTRLFKANTLGSDEKLKYIGLANLNLFYGGSLIETNTRMIFKYNFPFSSRMDVIISLNEVTERKNINNYFLTKIFGFQIIKIKTSINKRFYFMVDYVEYNKEISSK